MTEIAQADDGLPARIIKPHTLEKFDRHGAYCGIFTAGMKDRWTEPGGPPGSRLGYLELFAGPGLAVVDGMQVDGCPLIAAQDDTLFARLAFVEWDPELADALEQRLRARGFGPERALVIAGDANDPAVLEQAMNFLPAPGLIFAFIDPEDINGDWHAIEYLNTRRWPANQRVDFLVNLPMGPMKRNYSSQAITRVLGTDKWRERVDAGEQLGPVFRETYAEQFEALGLIAEHMPIRAQGSLTPVYDLVFASQHERGREFWKKISAVTPSGQRTLDL